jgi:LETM1 and EF-hand domain-containing protein 1
MLNAVFQKFYLRGLKFVNTHRKQVSEILARVKAGGQPLTRWETRFIETHRADVRKSVLPLSLNSDLGSPRTHPRTD